MRQGSVRSSILMLGVHCLLGCSVPEATPTPTHDAANRDRDREIRHEQRAMERRRIRLQKQILSDLRQLKESREAAGGATEQASDRTPEAVTYKLLVFGGATHEVYLGCMCDGKEPESVFNLTGEFGSDVSENSMRNKFAPYGSNNEDTSACSVTATHPPSVVASDGKSLGLLTLNTALKRRITTPSVADWLARMCSF